MVLPSINGDPPRLAGQRCDAIICEQVMCDGRITQPANVIYLCFDGRWHTLSIDYGMLFWSTADRGPRPSDWAEVDEHFPVVDLTKERSLGGLRLTGYTMEDIEDGALVTFKFVNGDQLAFRDVMDKTTWE